jgi:hypothetical protein
MDVYIAGTLNRLMAACPNGMRTAWSCSKWMPPTDDHLTGKEGVQIGTSTRGSWNNVEKVLPVRSGNRLLT